MQGEYLDHPSSQRECQPCTACCDGWLQFESGIARASLGCPCPHSTGAGCDSYAQRPVEPCRNFNCGWRAHDKDYPDRMRPDQSKVIILYHRLTWQGLPVDVAIPVGQTIPAPALDWLKLFAGLKKRPLLWVEQNVANGVFAGTQQIFSHGPPAFRQEMQARIQKGEKLW